MSLHLQLRLKNCLQTIIDIESDMQRYPLYSALKSELEILKKYLKDVENLDLSEDDVTRMEKATTLFLSELYLPINEEDKALAQKRVLQ